MESIKLLPHHARNVLMAYRTNSPGNGISYYNDIMRETDINNIKSILKNPAQTVKIVSTLDDLCRSCPYNKFGDNYNPNLEEYCELGSGKITHLDDSFWAEQLGLKKI